MKRLKNKILSMEPNTTTYKAMYEGSMTIVDPASTMPAYVDYSSTYYNESIGFDISTTHKLAQDKPTVVISIPCTTLGIDIPDKSTENVEADFCLRAFKKYVDELNAELYNHIFGYSGTTSYYHLAMMLKIGMIKSESKGKTLHYSINKEFFAKVVAYMKKFEE